MYDKSQEIASVISSRICHDLVSPLGAISNGLELMELAGTPRTQEFDLMSQSVSDANAKIQFFRMAFGAPGFGTFVDARELRHLVNKMYGQRRVNIEWTVEGDQPRAQVKLILLLLQCFESGLPRGGNILVRKADNIWAVSASGGELRTDTDGWKQLLGDKDLSLEQIRPADIHFTLTRGFIQELKLAPDWSIQTDMLKVMVETPFE